MSCALRDNDLFKINAKNKKLKFSCVIRHIDIYVYTVKKNPALLHINSA